MTNAEQVRLGRPSSFERDELVAAARELGPDNLALRKVADALGVPRTTVYNYVRSPEELGQLVLSSILASLEGAGDARSTGGGWETELEVFALRQRATLLAAGPWLRYYDPNIHVSRESLRTGDHLIETLVTSGFSPDAAGRAVILILTLVEESARVQGRGHTPGERAESYLWRLNEDEFPFIAAARVVDYPEQEERQFRYNLRCAIAGITTIRD